MKPLAFVAYYTPFNRHSLNAICAALEAHVTEPNFEQHTVNSLDALMEKAASLLRLNRRILIGWSFHTADASARCKELNRFRLTHAAPDVLHVAGGVHATALPESVLRAGFDYAVCGEGEATIIEIVLYLLREKPLTGINGLAFLDGQRVVINPRPKMLEMDLYPSFPLGLDKPGPIEITRGCLYACYYCQTAYSYGKLFRHRSLNSVLENVERMLRIGGHYIRFITPSALSYGAEDTTINPDAVELLLRSVRSVIGPRRELYFGTFPSEIRPEHITRESLSLLKKYVNNDNIIIGAQSGSDRILRLCNRGHTVQDVLRAVRLAHESGFRVNVDFIFGLPGETYEDALATVDCISRLADAGARIHGHLFTPLPGTPFHDKPAGHLWPDIKRHLDHLASRAALYGQWYGCPC